MQLLYFITTVTSQVHFQPGTISVRGTVLYWASSLEKRLAIPTYAFLLVNSFSVTTFSTFFKDPLPSL